MGKINSKQKGARGEREVRDVLKEFGYEGARRGQQYCGANGDADVVGLDGFHIEVKNVERLNLDDAYKQAQSDARENEIPVVVHKKSRKPWMITLDFRAFLGLLKKGE